mmetsp:Transcript_37560/g.83644  ORF Transcript_37560/g.83644 Transcript_37560/m.83644 type:complete len:89 (-) Transcript_37560:735-1001(-)
MSAAAPPTCDCTIKSQHKTHAAVMQMLTGTTTYLPPWDAQSACPWSGQTSRVGDCTITAHLSLFPHPVARALPEPVLPNYSPVNTGNV